MYNYINKFFQKRFRFLVCRHGQSTWNNDNKFTGWSNISLTQKGKFDAFKMGSIIKSNKLLPNLIYTSDSLRSIETADIIKKTIGREDIPILSNWKLNEKHYGLCEGIEREYIQNRYGSVYLDKLRKDYNIKPPFLEELIDQNEDSFGERGNFMKKAYYDKYNLRYNGENLFMVSNRIFNHFNFEILENFSEKDLPLIVTHKHPIRVIFKYIKNMPNEEFEEFDPSNRNIYYVSFENKDKVIIKDLC